MKKWGPLIILTMATFIIVVDTTIMNVSIPSLVEDLNTTVSGIQSAISIYALVMAAFVLTGGKLADIIGMKRTFLIGLIIFGVGTSVAAISTSLGMLIIGWSVLEGIGSALMLPNIQTILRSSYEGKDRALSYAIIGSMFAIAAAAGPLIGGYLTTFHTWRYAFAFELIVVVLVVIFSGLLQKDILPKIRPKLDYVGTLLSGLGFTAIILGILSAQTYGVWLAKKPVEIGNLSLAPLGLSVVPFIVGFGIIMLLIFLQWEDSLESKGKDPLIKPSILKNAGLLPSMSAQFVQLVVAAGFLFIFPLYLQLAFGLSAMDSGIALIPYSIAVLVFSLAGAKLASKFSSKRLIQVGFILSTVGFALMTSNIFPGAAAKEIIPGSLILGLGIGLLASQTVNLVLSTVSAKDTPEAAGLSQTFGQMGNAIGVALIGGILLGTLVTGINSQVNTSEVFSAEEKQSISTALQGDVQVVSDTQLEGILKESGVESEKGKELVEINSSARSKAFSASVAFLAFAALLGLVISPKLPSKKLV